MDDDDVDDDYDDEENVRVHYIYSDEGDGSRSPVCQSKGISCLAGGQLQYFAIDTNTNTNTNSIQIQMKIQIQIQIQIQITFEY